MRHSDAAPLRFCAAGLGARDSLRLEAGLCLYGNDLTEDITPVEAGLAWCIGACARTQQRLLPCRRARLSARSPNAAAGKRRREKFDFLGGSVVQKQLAEGATKRRIGLIIPAGAPARQHSKIMDAAGAEVGEVTSGGFSPCLQKNIAIGAWLQHPLLTPLARSRGRLAPRQGMCRLRSPRRARRSRSRCAAR